MEHDTYAFADRHIGPDADQQADMLRGARLRRRSTTLTDAAVPPAIRSTAPLDLPPALSEAEALAALRALADRNEVFTSLIGMGYSGTVTPGVILRNVLENPAWYTAYTPYQPEISQGRLEVLLNFQTMVADLTGMDLANASLLDEATAAAEAMAMCRRLAPKAGDTFFVDRDCHPQTIAVVQTRAEPLGIEVVVGDPGDGPARATGCSARCCSTRGRAARCATTPTIIERVHAQGALVDRRRGPARAVRAAPAGRDRRGHRGRLRAALRRAARLRRPARRVPRVPRGAQADAARPARRRVGGQRRAGPRCGSRCRPASSTSGGRRRRATSAPRRCCSR